MSAETKHAFEEALAAHIADEHDGALLTGYVLNASRMGTNNYERSSVGYTALGPDDQPYHVGLGLAHMMVDGFIPNWDDDTAD